MSVSLGAFGSLLQDPRVLETAANVVQSQSGGFSLSGFLDPVANLFPHPAPPVTTPQVVRSNIMVVKPVPWYVKNSRLLIIGIGSAVALIVGVLLFKKR